MKEFKCPHCGADLFENLFFSESGVNVYKINFTDDDIEYVFDEFYGDDNGTFYCGECGLELDLTEEKILKMLKGV
jgi:transcription elongation factor Elf1